MNSDRHISIIAEDFAGMRSQASGLAGYFSVPADFTPVRPMGLQRHLPMCFWPSPRKAIGAVPESDVIFSVAGKGGRVGAALRRSDRPVVQIQNPRLPLGWFDIVVANVHDEISGPNVLLSRTALHGLSTETLTAAESAWHARLKPDGRPLLAVLVGGANGRFRFGAEEARDLMRKLGRIVRHMGAHLFVTTSRRTGAEATEILKNAVAELGGEIWTGGDDNPYLGLVACADFLVVTADSVSMVSEAVAGRAPVAVYPLPGRSRRIRLFLEALRDADRVRFLEETLQPWSVTPLNDTPMVAAEVSRRIGLPLRV